MDRLPLIAKKDVLDSFRDRQAYFVGALFVLVGGLLGYLFGGGPPDASPSAVPRFSLALLIFLGVISAIALSYNQIVGKRTSGELRVLLGLPFSRFEVVYGTLLGRFVVVAAVSLLSLGTTVVVAAARGTPVGAVPTLAAAAAALTVVAVFVSVSVGLSAASKDTSRASVGAFGLFILILFRLWDLIPFAARFLTNGFEFPSGPPPTWEVAWGHLSPIAAIRNAVHGVAPDIASAFGPYAAQIPESEPVFTEPLFGAVVVLVWIVLPVTAGYYRLAGADL